MNDDDVFECVFKNDMLFKLINFPLLLFFFPSHWMVLLNLSGSH